MFKLIKKLFKRGETTTVYNGGKAYKFKSFDKAVAFMLLG